MDKIERFLNSLTEEETTALLLPAMNAAIDLEVLKAIKEWAEEHKMQDEVPAMWD